MAAIPWLPQWVRTWNLFAFGIVIPLLYLVMRWMWHFIHYHQSAQHHRDHLLPSTYPRTKQCGSQSVLRWMASSSPGRWIAQHINTLHITLVIMFIIGTGLTIWLELYYKEWCPISADMFRANENALHLNMRLLQASGLAYWADFGTLLSVLRGNKINVWDPDSDLGIIYPGDPQMDALLDRFPTILAEEAHLRGYDPRNVELIYHRDRSLIQLVFHNPAAHSDIWLWREQIGSKRPPRPIGHVLDAPDAEPPPTFDKGDGRDLEQLTWIYNDDYVVASSPRLKEDVIPVVARKWEAQGLNMTIPQDASLAARYEFGPNYMAPLLYRIQCEENLFLSRLSTGFYLTFFMITTIVITGVIRIWPLLPLSILPPPPRLALP